MTQKHEGLLSSKAIKYNKMSFVNSKTGLDADLPDIKRAGSPNTVKKIG